MGWMSRARRVRGHDRGPARQRYRHVQRVRDDAAALRGVEHATGSIFVSRSGRDLHDKLDRREDRQPPPAIQRRAGGSAPIMHGELILTRNPLEWSARLAPSVAVTGYREQCDLGGAGPVHR